MDTSFKRIVANLTDQEHLSVKLAAALQGSSINCFVRDNVLAAASKATAGLNLVDLSANRHGHEGAAQ